MESDANNTVHPSWVGVLTDPVRLGILHAMCELGAATPLQLSTHCHTSDRTVRRHLEALVALGLAREQRGERDGLTPGRPASRFVLDGEAEERVAALFELLSEPLGPWPR